VDSPSQQLPAEGAKGCTLCGDKSNDKQLTKYSNWGINEKNFVHTHLGKCPPDESYICKKHLVEAKRHHNDDTFMEKG